MKQYILVLSLFLGNAFAVATTTMSPVVQYTPATGICQSNTPANQDCYYVIDSGAQTLYGYGIYKLNFDGNVQTYPFFCSSNVGACINGQLTKYMNIGQNTSYVGHPINFYRSNLFNLIAHNLQAHGDYASVDTTISAQIFFLLKAVYNTDLSTFGCPNLFTCDVPGTKSGAAMTLITLQGGTETTLNLSCNQSQGLCSITNAPNLGGVSFYLSTNNLPN